MLPPDIPIFPLPNVVLFPNVFLPLHVFEPRYRAMVAETLEGDRIIGMVLRQPGYESDRGAVYLRYGPPDIWATFARGRWSQEAIVAAAFSEYAGRRDNSRESH